MPRTVSYLHLSMNGFIHIFLEMSFDRRFGKEAGRRNQGQEILPSASLD